MNMPNRHNGRQPKEHGLLSGEGRIVQFAKEHYRNTVHFFRDDYRCLTTACWMKMS